MSGGPRRSTERLHPAEVPSYGPAVEAAGMFKVLRSADLAGPEAAEPPTIVISPLGDHVVVGSSTHADLSGVLSRALNYDQRALLSAPSSFVEYSWNVGETSKQGESARRDEPQATVRVLTLNSSGLGSMNPITARLAELTRNYPLAATGDWEKIQDAMGPVRIFAIESEPVTFDVDQSTEMFTGRARVLADVLDPSDAKTFLESRVLDARVHGRFENGVPSIQNFEF